jgi:arsenate reductase-like glutaredoxin family protein
MTQPPQTSPSTLTETDLQHLRAEWQQTLNQTIAALRADLEHQLKTQLIEIQQPPNIKELRTRIATLERENQTLAQEHSRAIAQLQTEKETLTQQLKQAQDKLDRFRQLLNSNDPPAIEPAQQKQTHRTQQPQPNKTAIVPEPVSEIAPEPASKPRGPQPGKAFQRAETIVLAIKDWNRLHPNETFAINAGLLETVFRVHRQAVKTFLETYQNELWDYHQDLGVESPRWHNRGKDTQKLKTFVTQTTDP